jgi:hypothetical protein
MASRSVTSRCSSRATNSFKEFVLSLDLRENRTVRRLVEIMRERNLELHPELRQRVSEIVALADVQRLVPAEQAAFATDD